eukprot:Colp12_sorted_trinity150504_noHs@304
MRAAVFGAIRLMGRGRSAFQRSGVQKTFGIATTRQVRSFSSTPSTRFAEDQESKTFGASQFKQEGNFIRLYWDDGRLSKYHNIWLRDNCQCPTCLHPYSKQKLRSVIELNHPIVPAEVRFVNNQETCLHIRWQHDDHITAFPLSWLREHCYSRTARTEKQERFKPVLWGSEILENLPEVDYEDYMNDDRALQVCKILYSSCQFSIDTDSHLYLQRCMNQMSKYGLSYVRNTPLKDQAVADVALRVGPIRETFYGRTWDVVSKPAAENIAYTSLYLGLHQDLL